MRRRGYNLAAICFCLGLFDGCADSRNAHVVAPNEFRHSVATDHTPQGKRDVTDRQRKVSGGASPKRVAEGERDQDKDGSPAATDAAGALRFRRSRMVDDKGQIPPNALENARQQVLRMKGAQQKRLEQQRQMEQAGLRTVVPNAAGIEPDSWVWLGPGNVGGRIRSIAIHPTNTNTMWVGSVGGGIWRTNDGGVSWSPVNDFMANLAVSALVIDPANPNNMYAGTGEGFGNPDSLQGGGVFKSTDGGVTWNLLANTNPNGPFSSCGVGSPACPFFWTWVNRLAISPNGSTILAATNVGIARSTDGGANWTQITSSTMPDVLFLAGSNTNAVAGGVAFAQYSTTGGAQWVAANFSPAINLTGSPPNSNGRVELSTSPANSSIVYAAVDQNGGDIYRSSDSGHNFTRVNTGTNVFVAAGNSQGWYANALWQNPQDADTVVVGGTDIWRGTYSAGSLPLTQISNWQSLNSIHADHHTIVAHPGFNNTTNRIVYFGNDGGIFKSLDVGTATQTTNWRSLNSGLGITQFYSAAANVATGVFIGGAQDNGTQRYFGFTNEWTAMYGGDGGFCAADPTDSSYFYGEYIYLQINRSTDGGQSAARIDTGIGDANSKTTANFIAPFALDQNNPNTMLAGGVNLWRSQNVKAATPTWSNVKGPTTNNSTLTAIAISPANSSVVVVGHKNGDIYQTSNATAATPSWSKINIPGVTRFVASIVVDPAHGNPWIYATFGGFTSNNIYRSTAASGANWTPVTGSGLTALPAVPVYSFAVHPVDSNLLYAGTEIGVFVSEDAGANWEPVQDGPANVSVDQLFWFAGDLIAVTHGRGLFRASGGTYVDHNYSGPENGTLSQPFNTVSQGVNATQRYQAVWMRPASYNERLTISKRLELRSLGGTATIGR